MNILQLILGCKNSYYSPIETAAKETWIKQSPDNVKSIFMYGDSTKIYWDNNDSFYVNYPESLEHCLHKTITAFDVFLETDFDFIFRTNNTGYFDLNLVSQFVQDKPKNNFYCGCYGELNGINFASGSGYFISKDLVEKIVKNKNILYNYNMPGWCDDVMIGKFLTESLGVEIDPSARRLDLNASEISDDLDMTHYHYRILNKGNVNALYDIHKLKCKNQ
jgi:hypothetical protein